MTVESVKKQAKTYEEIKMLFWGLGKDYRKMNRIHGKFVKVKDVLPLLKKCDYYNKMYGKVAQERDRAKKQIADLKERNSYLRKERQKEKKWSKHWAKLCTERQKQIDEFEGRLSEILEIVKNRDRHDKELSWATNYSLLQQRFRVIEQKLEGLVGEEKAVLLKEGEK